MKAELVPENGDPPIPIQRDVTVVGRKDYCDVRIDDPSLSKRHCLIVKTDGLLVVRDLATTNGTKVKGQRVRWAALLPDDRLTQGAYKLRIYLGPDDLPAPTERVRRQAVGARAVPGPAPSASSRGSDRAGAGGSQSGEGASFPVPSSDNVPRLKTEDGELEILPDEDDGSDSGWRHLIKPSARGGDENFIIELD
ncbi:MAG: FHA domain-containing protein [Isosphaeraceae bacterium]